MSDPIKFIFIVTADHGTFEDLADERAMELCRKFYAARLKTGAALPAPAILRFVHFNCLTSVINVFDFQLSTTATPKPPTKVKDKWRSLSSFVASGDPGFSPVNFVDAVGLFVDSAGKNNLTILNIYHSVRGAPAGSVLELSIFSHGWPEGPLIQERADSNDNSPPAAISGLPMRNPNDTDGRARTDFEDNMGEDPTVATPAGKFPRRGGKDALKEFKAAFDPHASFIIFGCMGQDAIRDPTDNSLVAIIKSSAGQVINQAYLIPTQENEAKKKTAAAKLGATLATGNVPPDLDIPIDMDQEFRSERADIDAAIKDWQKDHPGQDVDTALAAGRIRVHYSLFDRKDRAADEERRRKLHYTVDGTSSTFFPVPSSTTMQFTRKWKSVLGLVARSAQQTYPFKAASKLGIDVLSGPVGTKSSVGVPGKNDQMKVCGTAKESECTRIVNFHELFMRPNTHVKSERRYFVYDSATVAHINQLARNP